MPDFWLSSGFHLLERDSFGRLAVTDDGLRAYFSRPEVRPLPESDSAETGLHRALLDEPRRAVSEAELAALADPDIRDNYRLVLLLRDWLIRHQTIEASYRALFQSGRIDLPPLFVDQMAHMVLRNILDGCEDPLHLRAAELMFRSQRVSLEGGAILLADEETVEMHATEEAGARQGLVDLAEAGLRTIELDVLTTENAALYWTRSDRFDTVLDISLGRPALDALCRVLEAWVKHFLGTQVSIQPVRAIRDKRWAWHVGLDAEASAIMNDLYEGKTVDEARLGQILSLFRLEFREPAQMLPHVTGRPVYLGLAMSGRKSLRLKPQNLLVNLPLAKAL